MQAVKALKNRRAEAYIGTGVKIIIAVVIGALILGGLYLLFTGNNGIFTNLNRDVQDMMNIENESVQFSYDIGTESLSSLQYTCDGKTWIPAKIPSYSENAVIVKHYDNIGTSAPAALVVVNDNDTIIILASTDHGATWTESRNFGHYTTDGKIVTYPLSYSASTGFHFIIKVMNPGGGGWGYDFKSTDGIKWTYASSGIQYF